MSDFEDFYNKNKNKKFVNIIQLCEVIITHFIENQ